MPASSYPLDDVLPHRAPMQLISEIVSVDLAAKKLTAAVDVTAAWCENWAAIEFMAQTAAALAGIGDRANGWQGAPRPGFLLGTRRLDLAIDRFEVGRRYLVTAENTFGDEEAASFTCEIKDGEKTVASAILNAYRPADAASFVAEH